jgi:Pyridoxamine 5'-phosphate oxidase
VNNDAVTTVDLDRVACLRLLGAHAVGRLCVLENGYPVAFPVNYRLVFETDDMPVIVVRVRPGSVLDAAGTKVGLQLDGLDPVDETGWSVLARGVLRDGQIEGAPDWLKYWDPRPWAGPRDQWMYMPVDEVSGRQLLVTVAEWKIRITGYL